MRITDTFIDFTVENCEKINKHWLFRKKFMTFYCHGGDESVDIGTFATGQELYDAINQYCNQYNCTPANVELECNGYNDEILKIYNFEGALDGTKKIATDLTITIFKSSAFKTLSQTFKRRSTTTKSRLVSYTINGLSASASLKQFVDKTKLLNLINDFNINNAYDFINAIGKCFPQQVEREENNKETTYKSKYQLIDFSEFGVKILLRVSNHNINAHNIQDDVSEAYSIVVKNAKNKNTFVNSDEIDIKEYVYFAENCDRHKYLLIAKNIYNLLETSVWDEDFVKPDVTNPTHHLDGNGDYYELFDDNNNSLVSYGSGNLRDIKKRAKTDLQERGLKSGFIEITDIEGEIKDTVDITLDGLNGTKKAVSETNDFCLELVISKNSLSRSSDLPTATQLSGVLSKATKAVPYTLTAPMLGGLIANKNEIKQSIKDFEKKIALWDKKPISNEYAFLLFVLSKLPHESSRNQSFYVIEENGNYRVRFSGHNALARYLSKNEQYKIGITFQSKDTPITFEPTFDVFYKEHVYYTEYLASDVLRDILQGIVDVLKGGFYNVPCDKELYSPNEKRYKEHFNINGLNGNNEPKIVSDLREKYNDRLFAFDNDNDYTFYGQDAEIISELFDIKISNGKCSVNKDFINRNLHKIFKNNRIAFVDKITSFKQNGNYQTFRFAQELSTRYLAGEKYDWTHAQKLAKELKIEATNQELMQACELAVVLTARKLASENLSIAERFQSMRDLYDQQVTVQPLDTKSRQLQQYSTPCPLAFLLGEYVKNAKSDSNRYLEPSAGNGMLTIALPPENTIVNELDEIRVANLKTLGFERVTQGDARELPATPIYKGIITNPPFAIVDKPETRNSWTLNALDYILTAHALDSMADNGRAAIIVGGKMWGDYWKPLSERSEKKVLYGKWKWFVGYLYAQYNVIDVIYVDSHGIYNKQGTTYPIVIILIDGRHQYNEDNKPNYVFDTDRDVIINNYQQLFERIVPHIQPQPAQVDDKSKRARALMLKIKMAKAMIMLQEQRNRETKATLNGLDGIDEETFDKIEKMHKCSSTIEKWINGNRDGRLSIVLPKSVEKKISNILGRRVNTHIIASNGIRHSYKNHGNKGRKLSDTDIPISLSDYMLIPYIMVAPDKIEIGSNDFGRESIRFLKKISNGQIIVVEKESLNDKNVFENVNMWGKLSDVVNAKNPNVHVRNVVISTSDVAKIIKDAETAIIKDKNKY